MPWLRKRRTLLYEAASTSIEKVESGLASAARKRFSSIALYASVLPGSCAQRHGSAAGAGATPVTAAPLARKSSRRSMAEANGELAAALAASFASAIWRAADR